MSPMTPLLLNSAWSRKKPFHATVIENRPLSGPGSAKRIHHLALDLAGSDIAYTPGDSLGVIPVNDDMLVDAWLERLRADRDVRLAGFDLPLGELLSTSLELAKPSDALLRGLAPLVNHDELTRVLEADNRQAIDAFLWGKDALDILSLKPDLDLDVAQVIGWLQPLHHRSYSIASSARAYPDQAHLTVRYIAWKDHSRVHRGVCSNFLVERATVGSQVRVFPIPNRYFGVPANHDAPMMMVGPGTGVAPFRAFLQERCELAAKGFNWLFFGDEHRRCDFIYEPDFSEMQRTTLLDRMDLAFSRDQTQKIYVQHRMAEHGATLFDQLENGGSLFVCGDAKRLAPDVETTLIGIIRRHGGLGEDAAGDYLRTLKREKRYVRDVY